MFYINNYYQTFKNVYMYNAWKNSLISLNLSNETFRYLSYAYLIT